MRTSVLCLALASALLAACGAAYAKTSSDLGKPVCSHYDDSGKQPASSAAEAAAASPSGPTSAAVATTPAPAPVPRSSGGDSITRPRAAPHWQTFLPGMFR